MDVMTATTWAGLASLIVGLATAYFRYAAKTKIANRGDVIVQNANQAIINNLRDEIERGNKHYNEIIERQGKRIDALEKSINELRNLEIQAASDFGALEMIIQTMPCVTCVNQGEPFAQMMDVVVRMKSRREKRASLIGVNEISTLNTSM